MATPLSVINDALLICGASPSDIDEPTIRLIIDRMPEWCNEVLRQSGIGVFERTLTLDSNITAYRLPRDVEVINRLFLNGQDITDQRVSVEDFIREDN